MSFKRGDTVAIRKELLTSKNFQNACFVTYQKDSDGGGLRLGNKESHISRGIGYFKTFSSSSLVIKKRLLTERINNEKTFY